MLSRDELTPAMLSAATVPGHTKGIGKFLRFMWWIGNITISCRGNRDLSLGFRCI
jgi:hypothetical protein